MLITRLSYPAAPLAMSERGRRSGDAADQTAGRASYGAPAVRGEGEGSTRKERLIVVQRHIDRAVTDRPPRAFGIEDVGMQGPPGVRIRGEVDVSAAPALAEALDSAIRATTGAFVIDLSAVDFLDSSGLSVLVRARALLGRDERELAVVCPPGPARRLFEVASLDDLFFLYDSRDEADAALVRVDEAGNGA
jgi:anti-anti-sigma factor